MSLLGHGVIDLQRLVAANRMPFQGISYLHVKPRAEALGYNILPLQGEGCRHRLHLQLHREII
jgi:hypothetical protein